MNELSKANYTILIVDDLEANLFALRQMLLPLGINIKTATSGEEGLKYLLNNHVDILLLDYSMPSMSGVEMAEHIHAHFAEPPPILFVTAHGHNVPGLEDLCYESGAMDFIEKPVKEQVLVAKLKVLLKLIEQKNELERLARVDSLTGLKNRLAFYDALEQTLSLCQRNEKPFAVLAIDLDDFKPVNDTYGHDAGDELLRVFAERLKQSVRISDTAARLGGDEFSVILANVESKEEAEIVATKIKNKCSKEVQFNGHTFQIKLSIGIAVFPLHGSKPKDLMKSADIALYQAKEAGKGNVQVLQDDDFQVPENLSDNLTLNYQPLVNSSTQLLGGEVLSKLGDVTDKSNVTEAIIQFRKHGYSKVFEQALCNRLKNDVTTYIHASGDKELIMFVNQELNELLGTEQTENLIKLSQELAKNNIKLAIDLIGWNGINERSHYLIPIKHLAHSGVAICLQDVGESIIPCALVRELNVKYLKLSRTIVDQISSCNRSQSMVSAIATLARSHNCLPIAVGVETHEQFNKLNSLGCKLYQGYLFDKPLPAEIFDDRINKQPTALHSYG